MFEGITDAELDEMRTALSARGHMLEESGRTYGTPYRNTRSGLEKVLVEAVEREKRQREVAREEKGGGDE